MTTALAVSVGRAKQVTAQLREKTGDLVQVIRVAQRDRVWEVLGYDGWDEYLRAEVGYERSELGRLLTIEQRRELVADLRANGATQEESADTIGVSVPTIKRDEAAQRSEGSDDPSEQEPPPRDRVRQVLAEKPDASVREVAEEARVSLSTVHAAKHAPTAEELAAEEAERERLRELDRRCSQLEKFITGWLMVREWDEPRMEVVDLLVTDQDREMFFELWSRIHD